jgi:energy-coupling factor transporter ATP-binding protein EcfA2
MLIASHHLDFLGAVTQRLVVLGESGVLGDGPTSRILGDAALLARAGLV